MERQTVINRQLEFYRKGEAGCLFAAHASLNPDRFEWRFSVCDTERSQIEEVVRSAIDLEQVSTQSIIFPAVNSMNGLRDLLYVLPTVEHCFLEQEEEFMGSMCLGYRMHIGDLTSWITGFGSFDFLPKTRQAPYTEITFRTKPGQIMIML